MQKKPKAAVENSSTAKCAPIACAVANITLRVLDMRERYGLTLEVTYSSLLLAQILRQQDV